jgi:hypothetical protein
MERTALIADIQHKIATIENSEVLKELQNMIDEIVFSDSINRMDDLPLHVRESIAKATKQLDDGKGIPHEQVMNEIRLKFSRGK